MGSSGGIIERVVFDVGSSGVVPPLSGQPPKSGARSSVETAKRRVRFWEATLSVPGVPGARDGVGARDAAGAQG